VALHLRNGSAVSHVDGALPSFGQRYTCLGCGFAVGATHHLRESHYGGQTRLSTLGS
jgi:hypothetical protein